jgi:hypothetical protein
MLATDFNPSPTRQASPPLAPRTPVQKPLPIRSPVPPCVRRARRAVVVQQPFISIPLSASSASSPHSSVRCLSNILRISSAIPSIPISVHQRRLAFISVGYRPPFRTPHSQLRTSAARSFGYFRQSSNCSSTSRRDSTALCLYCPLPTSFHFPLHSQFSKRFKRPNFEFSPTQSAVGAPRARSMLKIAQK